jgi:Zn-finger nucleic acid-binding protein
MKCPFCIDSELIIADWQGVEIDCCPKCRGAWLDRGELDKIIECSLSAIAQTPVNQTAGPAYGCHDGSPERYSQKHGYDHHGRRKPCFSEIFD